MKRSALLKKSARLEEINKKLTQIQLETARRKYPGLAVINWAPNARQDKFFELDAVDEALYGGAAGGGKSDALLTLFIRRRIEFPFSKGLLLRRTFPELEQSLILRSQELLVEYDGARYNAQKRRWIFTNGSILQFGYLKREADVHQYQSSQWDDIGFDELTHFTYFQYIYMLSRRRATVPRIKPIVRGATNPGNIGHGWVKERFIDISPPGQITKHNFTTSKGNSMDLTRCFIPAKVEDNPHLMERDPAYLAILENLPESERNALKHGDWASFSGQYFTGFKPEIHVIEPFDLSPVWPRRLAVDYGYAAPMCCLWGALDPDTDTLYIYRELYGANIYEDDQATKIAEMSVDVPVEDIGQKVGDPSMWIKPGRKVNSLNPTMGESIADTYALNGVTLVPANNDRIQGWKEVRARLKIIPGSDRMPTARVKIFNTCTNLIRTIPQAIHDELNVEDVNDSGEDHALDAWRYLSMIPSASSLPEDVEKPDGESVTAGQMNTEF